MKSPGIPNTSAGIQAPASDQLLAAFDQAGEMSQSSRSSITMLPPASSSARAPGGTTQVASYSSTISGPLARRARSARRRTGVSSQPSSRRNRRGAAAAGVGSARLGLTRSGHARPVAQALADDLDGDQLDRLLRAGAMAVGALVLRAEGFLQMRDHARVDRAVGHGHGQLEGLALVVQGGRAPDLARARR